MKQSNLDSFYERLEETVIQQAGRIINQNLFTKSILSTLPVALIAADTNSVILTSNKEAEQLAGIGSGPTKEANIEVIFASYPELIRKIRSALDNGEKARPRICQHSPMRAVSMQNLRNS